MKKVKLDFMVVPEHLETFGHVPKKVRLRFIMPESIVLNRMLGDSGRKLVRAGAHFYFTKEIAKYFIDNKIAEKV